MELARFNSFSCLSSPVRLAGFRNRVDELPLGRESVVGALVDSVVSADAVVVIDLVRVDARVDVVGVLFFTVVVGFDIALVVETVLVVVNSDISDLCVLEIITSVSLLL